MCIHSEWRASERRTGRPPPQRRAGTWSQRAAGNSASATRASTLWADEGGKRTRAPTACASTPRRRRRSTARSRRPRRLTLAERDNRNEFRLLEPRRARPRERRAARCRSRPSGRKARRLRGAERGGTPRRRVTSRHGAARAFCDTKIHDKHLAAPIRSDLVVPFLNRAQQRTRCGRRHPLRAHGDVAHAQPRA